MGPEVVNAVEAVWSDRAIRDEVRIDADALAGKWKEECVAEDGRCIGVAEAVEIPVCLCITLAIHQVSGKRDTNP